MVSEKYKRDSLGFLHYASSADANNLLRFNLPIFSSRHSAYVLYDCGASHKFVQNRYLKRLREEGLKIRTRMRGYMVVTTANSEERIPQYESFLEFDIGGYTYKGWFIHFDLLRYNIKLGKDWMATTGHSVDHKENILYLGYRDGRWDYSVVGLQRNKQRGQLGLPVEHLKALEEEVQETSTTEVVSLSESGIPALLKCFQSIFEEPVGLPPDHRNSGFHIQLKPDSNPPHRAPSRLTVKKRRAYD